MESNDLEGSAKPLEVSDEAYFWRDQRLGGLECLSATFQKLEFALHSHETFCIGAVEKGVQQARIRGTLHHSGPGDFYFINPEFVHEGWPGDGGYTYRMIYPSIELVVDLLEDATGKPFKGIPAFRTDTGRSPELATEFLRVHRLMESGRDRLTAESLFHGIILRLMQQFGGEQIEVPKAEAGKAVYRARDYLDAHFADDINLSDVSAAAGLSRAHLIRAFKKEFDLAPHAWLTDRRIREARRMLQQGQSITDTAFDCGFADQAHLTRHFKARSGVTPGQFRRALES